MTLAKEMFLREQIALEQIMNEAMTFQLEAIQEETLDEDFDFLFEEEEVKAEKQENAFKRFIEWLKKAVSKIVIIVKNFFTRISSAYKSDETAGKIYKSKYDVKKAYSAISTMHKHIQKFCNKYSLGKSPKERKEFINDAREVYTKLSNKENFDLEKYLIQGSEQRVTTSEFKSTVESLKKDAEIAADCAKSSQKSAEMALKRLPSGMEIDKADEDQKLEYENRRTTQELATWHINLITKVVSATTSLINSITEEAVQEKTKEEKKEDEKVKKEALESIYGEALAEGLDDLGMKSKSKNMRVSGNFAMWCDPDDLRANLNNTRKEFESILKFDVKEAEKGKEKMLLAHTRQFISFNERIRDNLSSQNMNGFTSKDYLVLCNSMRSSYKTIAKATFKNAFSAKKYFTWDEYYPVIKDTGLKFWDLLQDMEKKYKAECSKLGLEKDIFNDD